MDLAIVNSSSLVTDSDARAMAVAIDEQLREDVLPTWDRRPCSCIFLKGDAAVPAGVLPIRLFDDPDVADAYGYHDETDDGFIAGKVFCRTILAAGGGVLTPNRSGDSVSAVASHEAIEAKFDPNVNLWADGPFIGPDGNEHDAVSFELCDPVQAGAYSRRGVLLSDFVTRSWFDRGNTKGRFSWLGGVKGAFGVDAGGYLIVRDIGGDEAQVFGARGNLRPWRIGARRAARGLAA